MNEPFNFKNKSFAIYGLGLTGISTFNFLKKNKVKKIFTWDDFIYKKNILKKKKFVNSLNLVDFIVISPGINLKYSKLKKIIFKNKNKIISDLDLFYLKNNIKKSIVLTGTNGKSTTCSLIYHILKTNKVSCKLAGNIGKPVLDLKYSNKHVYVIEASSFQLEYSKFIKPHCAAILNISKDHLDWHGTKKNYINSKFKIFNNQDKSDKAFVKDFHLKKIYKKRKYLGKLNFLNKNKIIYNYFNNDYLKLKVNRDNLNFAYFITKKYKISNKGFYKSLNSFSGLPHRQEIFLKTKKYKFINDSKATSFEASKYSLISNSNIIWILGGKPKQNDNINLSKFKKKIIKAYIIGNHPSFFKKKLQNKINYEIIKNLKTVIKKIFLSKSKKKITILFSPASASFDQFKNFAERGEKFKRFVKYYAKKNN